MSTVDLPLLPLGRGVDLQSERGVECPARVGYWLKELVEFGFE